MGKHGEVELWGGAEYTCNRVEDEYLDQMTCSGHGERLADYRAFAGLGLKTLRVGMLWERHEQDPTWAWTDRRMQLLSELRIRPIVGLLHHGSGPPHTSLLDPEFASKLAKYAGSFAERYPSVDAYTPVNEPNTTARFSGRYGLWYPHHRSTESYLRALLHQLKGTVLSMRAIRRVQPAAQLIQTEDVGQIWSTPELERERDLLDRRRWLTYDLLCGEADRDHPLFWWMRANGISEREILWFLDNPCPPDVLGINYYVTSDRFLDHRVEHYPPERGSIEGPYVDVEAVRVRKEGIAGFEALLREAWQRYHLPVAITEVHLGDCAEEQIRWVAEAWEGVQRARAGGVDCRAMTVWALVGSYFWDVLVTRKNGHYEPGVFDVRQGAPAATPLAQVVEQLARGERPEHGTLHRPGWWRHASRLQFHPPVAQTESTTVDEMVA